jgi:hypothetical protein
MGGGGEYTKIEVVKPEGKGPLERLRHRWKNNIKWMYLS